MTTIVSTPPRVTDLLKKVATGKRGSRSLTADEAQLVAALIKRKNADSSAELHAEQLGAFLAAFQIKGVAPDEQCILQALGDERLMQGLDRLIPVLGEAPAAVKPLLGRLWDAQTLTREQARNLGLFLFDSQKLSTGWKGWAATLLRMRYETFDEYMGFLDALHDIAADGYRNTAPRHVRPDRIQVSEPFDGFTRSHMATPVVMADCNRFGYELIALTGEQPGPKQGMTLEQNLKSLDSPVWPPHHQDRPAAWTQRTSSFGWRLPQKAWWPASDEWVSIRRNIAKRPCLATLERLPNLTGAGTLITSAFHPPYGEKMLALGLAEGYRRVIIVQNGVEGGVTASVMRATRLLCAVQNDAGVVWTQITVEAPPLPASIKTERVARVDWPSNTDHTRFHLRDGRSRSILFDAVVHQTRRVWRIALTATQNLELGIHPLTGMKHEDGLSCTDASRRAPDVAWDDGDERVTQNGTTAPEPTAPRPS